MKILVFQKTRQESEKASHRLGENISKIYLTEDNSIKRNDRTQEEDARKPP
jgi:hypothetical protein